MNQEDDQTRFRRTCHRPSGFGHSRRRLPLALGFGVLVSIMVGCSSSLTSPPPSAPGSPAPVPEAPGSQAVTSTSTSTSISTSTVAVPPDTRGTIGTKVPSGASDDVVPNEVVLSLLAQIAKLEPEQSDCVKGALKAGAPISSGLSPSVIAEAALDRADACFTSEYFGLIYDGRAAATSLPSEQRTCVAKSVSSLPRPLVRQLMVLPLAADDEPRTDLVSAMQDVFSRCGIAS